MLKQKNSEIWFVRRWAAFITINKISKVLWQKHSKKLNNRIKHFACFFLAKKVQRAVKNYYKKRNMSKRKIIRFSDHVRLGIYYKMNSALTFGSKCFAN